MTGYHGNNEDGHVTPDKYICPYSAYCIEKSLDYVSCPDGTWTLWQKSTAASSCIPCQRGYFCKFTSMQTNADFLTWKANNPLLGATYTLLDLQTASPTYNNFLDNYYGLCSAGYVCYGGATTPTPTVVATEGGEPCPIGYFCPTEDATMTIPGSKYYGLGHPMPCLPGTYNPSTQQSVCQPCIAGTYCEGWAATVGTTCTKGYYCEAGSISPTPCPPGSYGSPDGALAVGECLPCDATYYCEAPGQFALGTKCASGFICDTGSDRSGPYATTSTGTTNGKCPAGVACSTGAHLVSGASNYAICPQGSYNDKSGASECLDCPPGYYCLGQSHKNFCTAGYYCSINSFVPAPVASDLGDVCPVYHYC